MNEQHQKAYIELIQTLLKCPKSERKAILQANQELITLGLIPAIQQVAAQKETDGEREAVIFLQDLSQIISDAFNQATKQINLYRELIEKILSSPEGKEEEILNANSDLIDDGFVEALEELAELYAQTGNKNATFLRYIAAKISALLNKETLTATPEDYANFFGKSLRLIQENDCDPSVVYPFFRQHQYLLNQEFAQRIHNCTGSSNPEGIARLIMHFSNLVAAFPLGDRASNLEIGIAGYETALQMISSEAFPKLWAALQMNIGSI